MGECILDAILRVVLVFRLQDYVLCVVCGLVAFGVSKARPHCRPFSWTDGTIDLPYGGAGTFPSWTLSLISVLPGVAYVLCEAVRHLWWLRRWGRQSEHGRREREPIGRPTPSSRSSQALRSTSPFTTSSVPSGSSSAVAAGGAAAATPPSPQAKGQPSVEGDAAVCVEVPTAQRAAQRTSGAPATASAATASPLLDSTGAGGMASRCGAASPNAPLLPPPRENGGSPTSSLHHRGSPRITAPAAGAFPLRTPFSRFLAHAHVWVLTQTFSVTLAMVWTGTIKVYAGRLRPDFLARLRLEGYSEASVDVDWCAAGRSGRVSFPSGHSSISFAAFVPFSFYVLHLLRVFRRTGVSLWCIVVGLLPQILPITVAISRTRDNRHHFDDILAGSLIGIASALIALGVNWVANAKTGQLAPRLAVRET